MEDIIEVEDGGKEAKEAGKSTNELMNDIWEKSDGAPEDMTMGLTPTPGSAEDVKRKANQKAAEEKPAEEEGEEDDDGGDEHVADEPESLFTAPEDEIESEDDGDEDGEDEDSERDPSKFTKEEQKDYKLKQLTIEKTKLKKELKELRQKIESGETSESQKTIAELTEALEKANLMDSPTFKARHNDRIQAEFDDIVGTMRRSGMEDTEAGIIASKLAQSDMKTREEVLSDRFSPVIAGAIFSKFDSIDRMNAARMAEIQNWRESKAAIAQEEERTMQMNLHRSIDSNISYATEALETEGNEFLKKSTASGKNATAWNRQYEDIVNAARHASASNDPKTVTKLMLDGATAPLYRKYVTHLKDRVASLEQELGKTKESAKRILGKSPGVAGNGQQSSSKKSKNKIDENLPPSTVIKKLHDSVWGD